MIPNECNARAINGQRPSSFTIEQLKQLPLGAEMHGELFDDFQQFVIELLLHFRFDRKQLTLARCRGHLPTVSHKFQPGLASLSKLKSNHRKAHQNIEPTKTNGTQTNRTVHLLNQILSKPSAAAEGWRKTIQEKCPTTKNHPWLQRDKIRNVLSPFCGLAKSHHRAFKRKGTCPKEPPGINNPQLQDWHPRTIRRSISQKLHRLTSPNGRNETHIYKISLKIHTSR